MKQLEAKNLTKTFRLSKAQQRNSHSNLPLIVAVNDLSLTLRPGEIYGLLGPNGAGKTTALRIISSLIRPDSGSVLYDGKDIRKNLMDYRKKIGFLTSELKLDDFFTPDYTFSYMARLYGMDEKTIQEKKKYLFDKFGVGSFKDVKIHDLSTGMKQKASLAISLCHDPELVIFDEPTNGLDIIASKEVEDFLAELRTQGKILLISTHIFSLVEKLCDRVGILLDGKLRTEGTLKDLTQTETLENVFFRLYHEAHPNEEH
jgi:sodium transport system ATP-binding protein